MAACYVCIRKILEGTGRGSLIDDDDDDDDDDDGDDGDDGEDDDDHDNEPAGRLTLG